MTLHLQERLNLGKGQVLPVAKCHQFVKGTEQVECIAQDLPLIQTLTDAGSHLGEKV